MAFTIHDWHLTAVDQRIATLDRVLKHDSENNNRYFTPGQRIVINQQMGNLFRFKSYLFKESDHSEVRNYELPEYLERNIETLCRCIRKAESLPVGSAELSAKNKRITN